MYRHFGSKVAVVQEWEELLPYCDWCGMNIPEGLIIRHRMTVRCKKNTQMRWRRRDVAIASMCSESTFSVKWEDEAERIEGVDVFKYLRRMLYQSDED